MVRDHEPIIIEEFNGLWRRGAPDECPIDHLIDCENIIFPESGVETRPGIGPIDLGTLVPIIRRIYNYVMQTGESLLILDDSGNIYHALLDGTVHGPILSIAGMTDFGFQSWAGRAYITPFETITDSNGRKVQVGMEDQYVYVYRGDGNPARLAAGYPPSFNDPTPNTPMIAYNSQIDGKVSKGIHIFAVTFSDGVDDSSALGPTNKPMIYAPGGKEVIVADIPELIIGATERRIWATKAIDPEEWSASTVYTFYLVKSITDPNLKDATLNFSDDELTQAFVPGTLPNPTSGGLVVENTDIPGYCDLGLHIIGVVYETDTGYLTAPGPEKLAVQSFVNERRQIKISNITVSPDSFVVKRHLVASRKIEGYNGDDRGYQLFFIPEGTIDDNVTTEKFVSFYDSDLVDDASHLIDNFSKIPAGVRLTTYNGRMVLTTERDNISLVRISSPGEPEAFDQVDGLVIIPLDGNPITTAQEFRGILYVFKNSKTFAVSDNDNLPSTWSVVPIDQGIGSSVHGVSTVLDSGGVNIDFLIVAGWSGVNIFNGSYSRPSGELTWKIEDLWSSYELSDFNRVQVLNDSMRKRLYVLAPDGRILYADYTSGLTPRDIKWAKWKFHIRISAVALIGVDLIDDGPLVLGSDGAMP